MNRMGMGQFMTVGSSSSMDGRKSYKDVLMAEALQGCADYFHGLVMVMVMVLVYTEESCICRAVMVVGGLRGGC